MFDTVSFENSVKSGVKSGVKSVTVGGRVISAA